jgi:hypothetical protein
VKTDPVVSGSEKKRLMALIEPLVERKNGVGSNKKSEKKSEGLFTDNSGSSLLKKSASGPFWNNISDIKFNIQTSKCFL